MPRRMDEALNVAILGAGGRMGRSLVNCIAAEPARWRLTGALGRTGGPNLGTDAGAGAGAPTAGVEFSDDFGVALRHAQVAIDFTLPQFTPVVLAACAEARVPLVIGTTGLEPAVLEALERTARVLPVVYARNFSPGVTLLAELTRLASRVLGPDYDAEIVEAHHRRKVDAPSGTALALGEAVAQGRGIALADSAVYARHGQCGPRENGEIGFSVIRGGSIVGDHTVMLAADDERIELTHRAVDRSVFARGALRAAGWLVGRPPGLYGLRDVLGLELPAAS